MLDLGLVEDPAMIDSFEQEIPGSNCLESSKGPVTPELDKPTADRGRFGLPTPDATPESRRIGSSNQQRVFAHQADQRGTGLDTPSISSRAPSAEELTIQRDRSPQSVHSDIAKQPSEQPSSPPASEPHLQEENRRSLSVVKSVFSSLIGFLNLAKQRQSRADDARVQSTLDLIKALPSIKSTRVSVGNLTRKLTAKQYGQLLAAIEASENEDFREKLRYDYTRHKKKLEIRMPTTMHEELGVFIVEQVTEWRSSLKLSNDPTIRDVAQTIKGSGSADIRFPFARGAGDLKSPDGSFRHKNCERRPRCVYPTLVIEIAWSQEMKYLQDKAEAYIRRSKGQIRTVVGVLMRKMYQAELRNEKRLYNAYVAGDVDDDDASYSSDDKNETGEASILVWRAISRRNGTTGAVCVQNEKFRDEKGRPVPGVALRLPLGDFICRGNIDVSTGTPEEQFEISSEVLCESIDDTLKDYRREREELKKDEAEEEIERRARTATQMSSRRKKETRTRGVVAHTSDDRGILGRIGEQGRRVSARLKG